MSDSIQLPIIRNAIVKHVLYLVRRRGGGVLVEITNCKHALYLVRRRRGGVPVEVKIATMLFICSGGEGEEYRQKSQL
jgi:hypothetical protein